MSKSITRSGESQFQETSTTDHASRPVDDQTTERAQCFITTATAEDTQTLNSLRRFRDESMAKTPVGRGLVGLYYRISPPIAETLGRNPDSRTANATRRLVNCCASLSDTQAETDSKLRSTALAVVLTILYAIGIVIAAAGHVVLAAGDESEK